MQENQMTKEHHFEDDITCPYCDYKHTDSYEWQADDGNTQCHSCEKIFYYVREIRIKYSTREAEKE